jgi:hypothetical protein
MKMKSVFAWLSAVVVSLSLGQAQAATLLVDDFNNLTAPPPGNQWSQSGAPVLGGTREFTKIGGTWAPGVGPNAGSVKYTTTGVLADRVEFKYDSQVVGTGHFNPVIDASAYSYLIVKGNFQIQAGTTAQAYLSTQISGGGFTDSLLSLPGSDGADGVFCFKLIDLVPQPQLAKVGRIFVRLNGLAAGDSYTEQILLADYCIPEPSTFALAGLAAVGLLIARRKKN